MTEAVKVTEKFDQFADQWSPKRISSFNEYDVRIAKLEGEFIWHSHDDTDELFYVVEGDLRIELRDGTVALGAGDLYIVPRGVEHRPVAADECKVMMLAPTGEANTGTVGGERTADVVDL